MRITSRPLRSIRILVNTWPVHHAAFPRAAVFPTHTVLPFHTSAVLLTLTKLSFVSRTGIYLEKISYAIIAILHPLPIIHSSLALY